VKEVASWVNALPTKMYCEQVWIRQIWWFCGDRQEVTPG